jgi:hypothetical protein
VLCSGTADVIAAMNVARKHRLTLAVIRDRRPDSDR